MSDKTSSQPATAFALLEKRLREPAKYPAKLLGEFCHEMRDALLIEIAEVREQSSYVSRDDIIEECAKVADGFNDPERVTNIVAAIRALKEKR